MFFTRKRSLNPQEQYAEAERQKRAKARKDYVENEENLHYARQRNAIIANSGTVNMRIM